MGEKSKVQWECAINRINPQRTPKILTWLKNKNLPDKPISDFRLHSVPQQFMPIYSPREPGKRTPFSSVAPACRAEASPKADPGPTFAGVQVPPFPKSISPKTAKTFHLASHLLPMARPGTLLIGSLIRNHN